MMLPVLRSYQTKVWQIPTLAAASNASFVIRRCKSTTWTIDPSSGVVSSLGQAKKYQSILGVEIHAQLDIPTKLFSPAPAVSAITTPPNTAVHPYDAALPGVLPSLSAEAVQAAVIAAHLMGCSLQQSSRFERKHYTYADLPHGYQITQQRWPIAVNGNVTVAYTVPGKGGKKKKIPKQQSLSCRINRLQLEQDSGKTVQVYNPDTGYRESRVDLNRAGQALVEIVAEPDLRTPLEAATLVDHFRQLFKHVGICNGRMEEGNLRCDLNVNLQDMETGERSARVEVKNLNSLRQIKEAAAYELHRHAKEWPDREETRTWNVGKSVTELIRRKDQAEDYRFMPEPDLPPVILDSSSLGGLTLEEFLETRIPELPVEAIDRFIQQYDLSEYQAQVIAGDPPAIPFLDMAIATAQDRLEDGSSRQQKRAVEMTTNFLINDLFGIVKEHSPNESEASVSESFVSPVQLGETVAMILNGRISTTMAKNLLHCLYTTEKGGIPHQVASDQGWQLISDPEELRALCDRVTKSHPDEVEKYREGGKYEIKMFKFFIGKVMAASRGMAEPERLKDILEEVLNKPI